MRYTDVRKQEIYGWFTERFVEPEACDPAESPTSGYQYSCGGPHFPKDIVRAQFSGKYPDEVIDEVVRDLESESMEWARRKTTV